MDLISKKEVLKILDREPIYHDVIDNRYDIIERIKELPYVIFGVDLEHKIHLDLNESIFMTEEQIKLFKDMVKIYYYTVYTISDNDTCCMNNIYEMFEKLESLTGQPVTDWI